MPACGCAPTNASAARHRWDNEVRSASPESMEGPDIVLMPTSVLSLCCYANAKFIGELVEQSKACSDRIRVMSPNFPPCVANAL